MREVRHPELSSFLEAFYSCGEVEASGRFKLSPRVAGRKLALYRLKDPHRWICAAASALLLHGATRIRLRHLGSRLRLEYAGPELNRDYLESLDLLALGVDNQRAQLARKHLSIALQAAQGAGAWKVTLAGRNYRLTRVGGGRWWQRASVNSYCFFELDFRGNRFPAAWPESEGWLYRLATRPLRLLGEQRWAEARHWNEGLAHFPLWMTPQPRWPRKTLLLHSVTFRGREPLDGLGRGRGQLRWEERRTVRVEFLLEEGPCTLVPVVAGVTLEETELPLDLPVRFVAADHQLATNVSWSEAVHGRTLEALVPTLLWAFENALGHLATNYFRFRGKRKVRARELLLSALLRNLDVQVAEKLAATPIFACADGSSASLDELRQSQRLYGYCLISHQPNPDAEVLSQPVALQRGLQGELLKTLFPDRREADEAIRRRLAALERQRRYRLAQRSRVGVSAAAAFRVPLEGFKGEAGWSQQRQGAVIKVWRQGRFLLEFDATVLLPGLPAGIEVAAEHSEFEPDFEWLCLADGELTSELIEAIVHTLPFLAHLKPEGSAARQAIESFCRQRPATSLPPFLRRFCGDAVDYQLFDEGRAVLRFSPLKSSRSLFYAGAGAAAQELDVELPEGFGVALTVRQPVALEQQLEGALADLVGQLVQDERWAVEAVLSYFDHLRRRGRPLPPELVESRFLRSNRRKLSWRQLQELVSQRTWLPSDPDPQTGRVEVLLLDAEQSARVNAFLGPWVLRYDRDLKRRMEAEQAFLERETETLPDEWEELAPGVFLLSFSRRRGRLQLDLCQRRRLLERKQVSWPLAEVRLRYDAAALTPRPDWNGVVEDGAWQHHLQELLKLLDEWVRGLPPSENRILWLRAAASAWPGLQEQACELKLLEDLEGRSWSLSELRQVQEQQGWIAYVIESRSSPVSPTLVLEADEASILNRFFGGHLHPVRSVAAEPQPAPELPADLLLPIEFDLFVSGEKIRVEAGFCEHPEVVSTLHLANGELRFKAQPEELTVAAEVAVTYERLNPRPNLVEVLRNRAYYELVRVLDVALQQSLLSRLEQTERIYQLRLLCRKVQPEIRHSLSQRCYWQDALGQGWSIAELRQQTESGQRVGFLCLGPEVESTRAERMMARDRPLPRVEAGELGLFQELLFPTEDLDAQLDHLEGLLELPVWQPPERPEPDLMLRWGPFWLGDGPGECRLVYCRWGRLLGETSWVGPVAFEAHFDHPYLRPQSGSGGLYRTALVEELKEEARHRAFEQVRLRTSCYQADRCAPQEREFFLSILAGLRRPADQAEQRLKERLQTLPLLLVAEGRWVSVAEALRVKDETRSLEWLCDPGLLAEFADDLVNKALGRRRTPLFLSDDLPRNLALELEPKKLVDKELREELEVLQNRNQQPVAVELESLDPEQSWLLRADWRRTGFAAQIGLGSKSGGVWLATIQGVPLARVKLDSPLSAVVDGPFLANSRWDGLGDLSELLSLKEALEDVWLTGLSKHLLSAAWPSAHFAGLLERLNLKELYCIPDYRQSDFARECLRLPLLALADGSRVSLACVREHLKEGGELRAAGHESDQAWVLQPLEPEQLAALEEVLERSLTDSQTEAMPVLERSPERQVLDELESRLLALDPDQRPLLERLSSRLRIEAAQGLMQGDRILNRHHRLLQRVLSDTADLPAMLMLVSSVYSCLNHHAESVTDQHERRFHAALVQALLDEVQD